MKGNQDILLDSGEEKKEMNRAEIGRKEEKKDEKGMMGVEVRKVRGK